MNSLPLSLPAFLSESVPPWIPVIATILTVLGGWCILTRTRNPRDWTSARLSPHVVHLYQYPAWKYSCNGSPFIIKIHLYCKFFNIPVVIHETTTTFSTKGKLPFIVYNNREVADSSFILDFLEGERKIDSEKELTPQQRAISHSCKKMIEESLYFVLMYFRWRNPPVSEVRKSYFDTVPWPVNYMVCHMVMKNIISQLHGQGTGRHSKEEILLLGQQDLKALEALVGGQDNNNKKYFMGGEKPSKVDATVYSFVSSFLYTPYQDEMNRFVLIECPNLVKYCTRIRDQYFQQYKQSN